MSEKSISKRKKRRYKKRLKTPVKFWIAIIVILACTGAYCGVRIYRYTHSENPYGKVGESDPQEELELLDLTEKSASYEILDVGSGEAILIRYEDREALIDTGTEASANKLKKALEGKIKGKLDYLVITGPSAGRIGGIKTVAEDYQIATCIVGELGDSENAVKDALKGKTEEIVEGENATFDLGDGVTLFIIKPDVSSADPLDRSLVTYFTFENKGFIALSDAGREETARALSGINRCEVVVLSRNGNKDAYRGLTELVQADYYIASTSKEAGFPTLEAEDYFSNRAYSTGARGNISFTVTGSDLISSLEGGYEAVSTEEGDDESD